MPVTRQRPGPSTLLVLCAGCFAFLSLLPSPVWGGGVTRPNVVGARAVGMGGAYTAVADDALSIWHNPAGLARMRSVDIVFGLELPFAVSRYDPVDRADPLNPGQTEVTPVERPSLRPTPVPVVAGGGRVLVGPNSFLAFGLGFYHSMGGGSSFDKKHVTTEGLLKSMVALLEIAPAVAYQVHERIFIGATLRVGVGLFSALQSCSEILRCEHDPPGRPVYDTRVHTMTGGGVGYSLGIQVLPAPWLTLGLTYRSNLDVTVSGRDALETAVHTRFDTKVKLPFPQTVAVGIAARVHPRVLVAAQGGWSDNSRFRKIFLDVEGWTYGQEAMTIPLLMEDSFSAHLGVEILAHEHLLLRAGMAYDTPSIPAASASRALADNHKVAWDLGLTFRYGRWRLDLAAEARFGDLKNRFQPVDVPAGAPMPGRHYPGGLVSLHLGGGVAW